MRLDMLFKDNASVKNCLRETMGAGIFGLFGGSFYPFLGIYLVHTGGNAIQLGLLGCAPFLGNIAAPLWANFSNKFKLVPYITTIHVIARLIILPVGFINMPWIATLLILLHFIIASMAGPAYNQLLRSIYPASMRGRAMSAVRFILGGVQSFSLIWGGIYLDQHAGWLFFIGGCCGIIALIPFSRIKEPVICVLEKANQSFSSGRLSFRNMMKLNGFGLFLLAFMLFETGNLLSVSVYPVYQVNELHLESKQVAVLGTLWMSTWCLTYPLWGVITDRIGPKFCLFAGFLLQLFTPLAYSLSDSFTIIQIASILGGSANSALDVAWITTLMGMSEKHVLQTSSFHMQLSGIRGASLPLVGSLLASSIGGATVFTLSSIFIALSLIPAIIIYKKVTRL
jgi:MFS family permease